MLGLIRKTHLWMLRHIQRGIIPAEPLTIILAGVIGVLAGYGAAAFTFLIDIVTKSTLESTLDMVGQNRA